MKINPFLRVLRNKNFLRVWLSQVFSLVSAATLTFVLVGKIFSVTQSSVAVGLYIFFYYLPTLLLGPFVGVFVDSWNHKSILIYSNLIQAILVLFFAKVQSTIWPIYCLGFLYSLGDEFYNPTVGADLPILVRKEDLTVANTLFFITNQGSLIAGSFVGGLMLKLLPNSNNVFLIVCFTLMMTSIVLINIPAKLLPQGKKRKIDWRDPLGLVKAFDLNSFWEQAKEGYDFIRNESMVLFPILLLAGLQILTGMGVVLLPPIAKMIQLEFADSSFLVILPACLGALTGSWLLNHTIKKARKNTFIISGLAILGSGILALAWLSLVLQSPTFLAVFMGLTLGIGYVFVYIPLQTLIQEHTPFNVRGRVFGTLSTVVTLAAAIPMLITATIIDILGVRLILNLFGAGIIFLALIARKKRDSVLTLNNK